EPVVDADGNDLEKSKQVHAASLRAGAPERFNSLFHARDVVAQAVRGSIEFLNVAGGRDQRMLLGPVFGERAAGILDGLFTPAAEGSTGFRHAVGGNVAENTGEVLLHVPAQVARDLMNGRREFGI